MSKTTEKKVHVSRHVFDKEKWARLSIFEQMGNSGSEVVRALSAKERGDQNSLDGAFYRGLDLFDATVESLVEQGSPRFKEVLIARDQFGQTILGDKHDPKLDDYFMQFAIAARLRHGL